MKAELVKAELDDLERRLQTLESLANTYLFVGDKPAIPRRSRPRPLSNPSDNELFDREANLKRRIKKLERLFVKHLPRA